MAVSKKVELFICEYPLCQSEIFKKHKYCQIHCDINTHNFKRFIYLSKINTIDIITECMNCVYIKNNVPFDKEIDLIKQLLGMYNRLLEKVDYINSTKLELHYEDNLILNYEE